MKANELMLGDWVQWKPSKGGFIGIVGGDSALTPEFKKIKPSHFDSSLSDYYPIPLTPEILEKNGWKEIIKKDKRATYNSISISYEYAGDCKHLHESIADVEGLYDKVDDYRKGIIHGFRFSIKAYGGTRDTIISKYIRYVHELQHALRLCGLNTLADNFQIK